MYRITAGPPGLHRHRSQCRRSRQATQRPDLHPTPSRWRQNDIVRRGAANRPRRRAHIPSSSLRSACQRRTIPEAEKVKAAGQCRKISSAHGQAFPPCALSDEEISSAHARTDILSRPDQTRPYPYGWVFLEEKEDHTSRATTLPLPVTSSLRPAWRGCMIWRLHCPLPRHRMIARSQKRPHPPP